jgi:hypothetical protein
MPTRYKAKTGFKPIEHGKVYDDIAKYVGERSQQIVCVVLPNGRQFSDEDELDGCGSTQLVEELEFVLARRVFCSLASPRRPAGEVIALLREIARNPDAALNLYNCIDPQAMNMLASCFCNISPTHRLAWQRFLIGTNDAIKLSELARAATEAIAATKGSLRRGRAPNIFQEKLAMDLGELFCRYNVGIKRRVKVSQAGRFEEDGRFKSFLQLLMPLCRPYAKRIGRDLNVDTMVRIAKGHVQASS